MVIAQHGGDTFSREIRYDFSSNLNPLGMPRRVKEALQSAVFSVIDETVKDALVRINLQDILTETEKEKNAGEFMYFI